MPRMRRPITNPNLGLYLGIPPASIPSRGLSACINVRVKQGKLVHDNLGWANFPNGANAINLDGRPVMLLDRFLLRDGVTKHVWANTTDLFEYDASSETVAYLTPRYETGTVEVTNGSTTVTGTGTSWSTELKAGDFIHVGATGQTDPAATWYRVDSVTSDTELELTVAYAEATSAGEAYTARVAMTGDLKNPLITERFYNAVNLTVGSDGDRWYVANGVDPVMAWDGNDDQAYFPDLGDIESAVYLRRYSNVMMFVSPTVSGEVRQFSVRTSAIGEPENVVTGEASEFVVHDRAEQLYAAEPIGELLAFYAERSITLAQFVGPPLMFVFRPAVAGDGPVSSRAIATFPDAHYFMGVDTQYVFDGARAAPINTHVWREVMRRTTPIRYPMVQSFTDEENGDVLWSMPLTTDASPEDGAPEEAYVHHYLEEVGQSPDPHTRRELPFTAFGKFTREDALTWDMLTDSWEEYNFRWNDKFFHAQYPMSLAGDADGNVFSLNTVNTKSGVEMDSYARFGRRALGNVETATVLRRVYPFVEQLTDPDATLNVRIYGTDSPDGKATLLADQLIYLALPDSRRFTNPRKAMRYVELEVGREATAGYWALYGYDLDATQGASR